MEAILDLVPQPRLAQRLFDGGVELRLRSRPPVDARAISDILEDRFGEGVGLLAHHADPRAQLHPIPRRIVDILAVARDRAFDARAERTRLTSGKRVAERVYLSGPTFNN